MENHILVGVGGTGGKILKAFRKRLFAEFTDDQLAKLPISFVYVDSSNEMMNREDVTWRVLGKNAIFNDNQFVNIKGISLNEVFASPSSFPGLKGFIGDPEVMKKTLGEVGAAAAQKRRAGRILFASNIDKYINALTAQYNRVNDITHATRTNIHIFTGLAGGTGSGSVIDLVSQTRMIPQFREGLSGDGKTGTSIVLYCMTPEITPPAKCDAGRYHANGYAALMELNALMIKKYIPHDVTGKNDRLNLEKVAKVVDGCIVYSNVNENGLSVESHEQLPALVSDFVFNRVFLPYNNNTEEFLRSYSFENINDWDKEKNEKSKEGVVDYVRSKTVSSFGIKRIMIPEEEITEYFTFNLGRQALLQMRYNNWADDMGYRDTPANVDFHSEVKEPENWNKWRISDKHLMLNQPILNSDIAGKYKWPSFNDYWVNAIDAWTDQARSAAMPLNELEKFCNEGYSKFFRKVGVAEFFEGKTRAKEEHANEIVEIVEKQLFDKWASGDYSLYNLQQFVDRLKELVDDRRKSFETKISQTSQALDQLEQARVLNRSEWENLGLIGGLIKKNKIIQQHATILQQIYIKRTEMEGMTFAMGLLASLFTKFNQLRSRIDQFVATMEAAFKHTEAQIGSRCQDNGGLDDTKQSIIRFYKRGEVVNFTQEVIRDKNRQKGVAAEMREALISTIGTERSFVRANAQIDKDQIAEILDTTIRRKAIAIHNDLRQEEHEKLIGRNIMEQLSEIFQSDDQLHSFAKDVVEKSGVYSVFDPTEIKRAVKNNEVPSVGRNIMRKIVFINLPEAKGNEQVMKFSSKFKQALIDSVEAGIQVKIDETGSRKNEITILTIAYCFPLRTLRDLRFMEERYLEAINNPNTGRENRTVLHTEGTGEQFPNLFMAHEASASEIREQYTKYLIAAYAIGHIRYADREDGTGLKAYGTISISRTGLETLNPIANKFTEIPYMYELFTEAMGEELKAKVAAALQGEYLHVEKRKELLTTIQGLIRDVILPECDNNKGSEKFLFFNKQAEGAMDVIEGIAQ